MGFVSPRALRSGDHVAVLAASGPPNPETLESGLARLRSWGLNVDVLPSARAAAAGFDYLAGADDFRAADVAHALTNERYAAVIFARGGYGVQRMLEHLDWPTILAAHPTPRHVVGFSDVTAVQEAVMLRLGWQTLYAAMPATWYFTADRAADSLRTQLFAPETVPALSFSDGEALVSGTAEGPILGGCATLLSSSLATASTLRPDGAILFLEDVDELPFRLDRVFTQMRRAGYLDGVRAVLAGTFDGCGDPDVVRTLLLDRFGDLEVPVLAGADIGHGVPLQALPLGRVARLDADAATLTFAA